MSKTSLIMVQEIRTTIRRKTFMIFSFGLPLLVGVIALVFILVNRDSGSTNNVVEIKPAEQLVEGYVDEGALIQSIPEDLPSDWLVAFGDLTAAKAALEAEEITGYYVIPADYAESGNLRYITDSYDPIGGGLNSNGMEWILAVNLLGDMELASNVWNPMNISYTSLSPEVDEEIENSWIAELLPNIMALVLYLVIIMTASILVAALTDEKKNRILEVLLSSVSSNQLITGKILAAGFLGMLTLMVWVGVLWGVVSFGGRSLSIPEGFSLSSSLLIWAIVYALLGYAMYGSQMAGLGALVPDIKDSRGLSFVVLAPLIIVYMFLTIIVTRPDGTIAIVLSMFPLTAPVGMITRMAATEVPMWQAFLSAFLQLIAVVIIVRLAARLFRAQTLLSGQPVNIRRYYAAMFGKHNI